MGHNTSTEKRRTTLMRLPLSDLAGWHLLAACPACRDERIIQLDGLIERYGGTQTLILLVPRLRCRFRNCRQPAAGVRLRNRFPVHPGPALIDVVLKGPGAF